MNMYGFQKIGTYFFKEAQVFVMINTRPPEEKQLLSFTLTKKSLWEVGRRDGIARYLIGVAAPETTE
jgi:hypothetical protein